jgi:hypothetical protein
VDPKVKKAKPKRPSKPKHSFPETIYVTDEGFPGYEVLQENCFQDLDDGDIVATYKLVKVGKVKREIVEL